MTAFERAAKRARGKKTMSQEERELREYRSNVRYLQRWCEENQVAPPKTWEEANLSDICVVSKSEYDLHEDRANLAEDNGSYFISPEVYEWWCED